MDTPNIKDTFFIRNIGVSKKQTSLATLRSNTFSTFLRVGNFSAMVTMCPLPTNYGPKLSVTKRFPLIIVPNIVRYQEIMVPMCPLLTNKYYHILYLIGALIDVEFIMRSLRWLGLAHSKHDHVLAVSVLVIGDICNAMEWMTGVEPHNIMPLIAYNIQWNLLQLIYSGNLYTVEPPIAYIQWNLL